MAATQGARNASPRTQSKRPGDLTGVRGQALAEQAQKEKAEAATQVETSLQEQRRKKLSTEIDYRTHTDKEGERVRVNFPVEQMTFGRQVIQKPEFDDNGTMVKAPVLGSLNQYDFEEGVWYHVDTDLANHLARLGYIYE